MNFFSVTTTFFAVLCYITNPMARVSSETKDANETDTVEGCITSRTGEAVFRVTGVPGALGPQGPPGFKGEVGPIGRTGVKGESGTTGEKGEVGEGQQGRQGVKGSQGLKGDTGSPGLRGPVGMPGPPGVRGSTGEPGRNGVEGRRGPEGSMGIVGSTGLPGSPGGPGPPGTAHLTASDHQDIVKNLTGVFEPMFGECCRNSYPPKSCQDIFDNNPSALTDYYIVSNSAYDPAHRAFCEMEEELCGETGGWMQIIHFDVNKTSGGSCPSPLLQYQRPNSTYTQRACGKPVNGGQYKMTLSTHGITYSKVCGRIRGYQVGSPDAFNAGKDGIQITGGEPEIHLWSYIAGWSETTKAHASCPCAGIGYGGNIPISNNYYYCESGNDAHLPAYRNNHIFWDDPLWDGRNCPSGNSCCLRYGWFSQTLPKSSGSINLSWTLNEGNNNEDIYLDLVKIYVK